MSDLTEFLRARLDEDEAQANTSRPGFVSVESLRAASSPTRQEITAGSNPNASERRRALLEVETKRRIIRWVETWPWRPAPPSSVDGLLELLALPYADHPDYRQEWSVT